MQTHGWLKRLFKEVAIFLLFLKLSRSALLLPTVPWLGLVLAEREDCGKDTASPLGLSRALQSSGMSYCATQEPLSTHDEAVGVARAQDVEAGES